MTFCDLPHNDNLDRLTVFDLILRSSGLVPLEYKWYTPCRMATVKRKDSLKRVKEKTRRCKEWLKDLSVMNRKEVAVRSHLIHIHESLRCLRSYLGTVYHVLQCINYQ